MCSDFIFASLVRDSAASSGSFEKQGTLKRHIPTSLQRGLCWFGSYCWTFYFSESFDVKQVPAHGTCLFCPCLDLCSHNPDVVFSDFLRWDFSGSIQKKDFRPLLIIKGLSAAFISCLSLFSICMEIYRPLRLLIWHCLSMLQVLCRYQHIWNIDLRFRPAFLGGIMQATGS